jgi:hypothetical protein
MSFEAETALRPEIARDERLLWSGMPRQGIRFRPSDILMVPFSLMWGGFAFFWEYSVVSSGHAPVFFALWGVPFVLVGVYIIVGRFFVDSFQRARTYFGVTDQRVIILSGLFNRDVKSISLRGLSDISLNERGDASGDITFGPTNPMAAMWSGTAWPGMSKKFAPAFELVDGVRRVYELIREQQRSA